LLIETFLEWRGATPLAISISALVALWAVVSARDLARKRNAIDLVIQTHRDDRFIKGIDMIRKIHHDETEEINRYAYPERAEDEKAASIRYILNFMEHMSIGIFNGTYDEKIIKETMCSFVVNTWGFVEPYVKQRRSLIGSVTAFAEVEKLAGRWRKKPLKPRQTK
jgi:hypothetical protein